MPAGRARSLSTQVIAEHTEAAQEDHELLEVHHVVLFLQVLQQHPEAAPIQLFPAQSISGAKDSTRQPWHRWASSATGGFSRRGNLFQGGESPSLTPTSSPVVGRDMRRLVGLGPGYPHAQLHEAGQLLQLALAQLVLVMCGRWQCWRPGLVPGWWPSWRRAALGGAPESGWAPGFSLQIPSYFYIATHPQKPVWFGGGSQEKSLSGETQGVLALSISRWPTLQSLVTAEAACLPPPRDMVAGETVGEHVWVIF